MLKYSKKQRYCLTQEKDNYYLVDLRSGFLNGYTSVLMWFFSKKSHQLNNRELCILENDKFIDGSVNKNLFMTILISAFLASIFGEQILNIKWNIASEINFILFFIFLIMGFILCLINKRKDKQELAKLLGEIVFDTEIKIEFSSKIDKFIYFFKMILALFVCVLLFIGGGFYFAVIQSNPFGLLAVFLFSYIVFGTSSILPKNYNIKSIKGRD
ncbi:MAG: DUF443 family protein [Thomasclavelia sp.]|uniref:DUF443 family protein n=1 Tax=Thomasclavelia sp. TaxID=3025757 RepID=UPI0039A3A913